MTRGIKKMLARLGIGYTVIDGVGIDLKEISQVSFPAYREYDEYDLAYDRVLEGWL